MDANPLQYNIKSEKLEKKESDHHCNEMHEFNSNPGLKPGGSDLQCQKSSPVEQTMQRRDPDI